MSNDPIQVKKQEAPHHTSSSLHPNLTLATFSSLQETAELPFSQSIDCLRIFERYLRGTKDKHVLQEVICTFDPALVPDELIRCAFFSLSFRNFPEGAKDIVHRFQIKSSQLFRFTLEKCAFHSPEKFSQFHKELIKAAPKPLNDEELFDLAACALRRFPNGTVPYLHTWNFQSEEIFKKLVFFACHLDGKAVPGEIERIAEHFSERGYKRAVLLAQIAITCIENGGGGSVLYFFDNFFPESLSDGRTQKLHRAVLWKAFQSESGATFMREFESSGYISRRVLREYLRGQRGEGFGGS